MATYPRGEWYKPSMVTSTEQPIRADSKSSAAARPSKSHPKAALRRCTRFVPHPLALTGHTREGWYKLTTATSTGRPEAEDPAEEARSSGWALTEPLQRFTVFVAATNVMPGQIQLPDWCRGL